MSKKLFNLTMLMLLSAFILSLYACAKGEAPADESSNSSNSLEPITIPDRMFFSNDGVTKSDQGIRLITGLGSQYQAEFYSFSTADNSDIKRIDLTFSQSDWWTQMINNHSTETDIPATMTYDGATLTSSVGVRFKGVTSFNQNNTEKKSFNISLDYSDSSQSIDGFKNLNLNCAWGDYTFMREVIYEHINQWYIPAVSNNYVELYINGVYWGIYINSQQIDKNYIREWFTSTKGTLWRADSTAGGTIGTGGTGDAAGGDLFGTGKGALNYLGDTSADYSSYYSLKSNTVDDPWASLIDVCNTLENSSDLENEISQYLDLDKTLWFLIMENVFADEDSYIFKGGMDWYQYWDYSTNLLVPLEYDGNETLRSGDGTMPGGGTPPGGGTAPGGGTTPGGGTMEDAMAWTPFSKSDNSQFPLLYKLLNISGIRQRYLAHIRTVLNERFNETYMNAMIDGYAEKIESYVSADPKNQYKSNFSLAVEELKTAVKTRYDTMMADAELNAGDLHITEVSWNVNGIQWAEPAVSGQVFIKATVTDPDGIGGVSSVYVYSATGLIDPFSKAQMYDDGNHEDGSAGDGVYGAVMSAPASGTRIRFYIEAVANNTAGTRTYNPAGAEHDVFTFLVN